MRAFYCILIVAVAFAGCSSVPELDEVESQRAAELYASCLVCHSMQEASQKGPHLGGMERWYLLSQLKRFKSGARGSHAVNAGEALMESALDGLREQDDLALLATYISRLPSEQPQPAIRGDVKRGSVVYQSCVACHGEKGEGKKILKAPALAGMEDWYLLDQLRQFKSGGRGYHKDDGPGRTMAAAMAGVAETDFRHVVAYIATLGSADQPR